LIDQFFLIDKQKRFPAKRGVKLAISERVTWEDLF